MIQSETFFQSDRFQFNSINVNDFFILLLSLSHASLETRVIILIIIKISWQLFNYFSYP